MISKEYQNHLINTSVFIIWKKSLNQIIFNFQTAVSFKF